MAETMALNLAYLLYVGSGFVKTVLKLRIALIVVSIAFIIWAVIAQAWSAVFWNAVFGSVHGYQLYQLWVRNRAISLTATERALHKRLFSDLSLVDFYTLWSIGTARTVPVGELLAVENVKQETIMLIVDGEVKVERDGQWLASLGPDSMIGERSYLTGDPANASASRETTTVVHEWNQQKMAALVELCPEAHDSLLRFLGIDLANKLN